MTLMPLSNYKTQLQACNNSITAILSYSKYAGRSHIDGAALDAHGNAAGVAYDLGADGAFQGMTAVILQLYPFSFGPPRQALEEKGFKVVHWTGPPPVAEFEMVLSTASQLWVIANERALLSDGHLDAIQHFYEAGHGVYIWGDNQPFYVDANQVLGRLIPGVHMEGSDDGGKHLMPSKGCNGTIGYQEHLIFTGIERLFEGITIARIRSPRADVRTIMINSHGNHVTAVVDDGKHRLAIDGAFTRLYCQWDGAGTARFVKNVSAWLCGIDADWL